MATLAAINVTPVKGLALQHPDEVELTAAGVVANRRFYLISGGLLYNGKQPRSARGGRRRGSPADRLTLAFPDGASSVAATVELGAAGRDELLGPPGAGADSSRARGRRRFPPTPAPRRARPGRPAGGGVDVRVGTMLGRASCERLGEELGAAVDPRRFRMLLELDGLAAHEEDDWRGRQVRSVRASSGPAGRCRAAPSPPRIPTRAPSRLDTLRGIPSYRGLREGKGIDFGVYFDVVQPGRVASATRSSCCRPRRLRRAARQTQISPPHRPMGCGRTSRRGLRRRSLRFPAAHATAGGQPRQLELASAPSPRTPA